MAFNFEFTPRLADYGNTSIFNDNYTDFFAFGASYLKSDDIWLFGINASYGFKEIYETDLNIAAPVGPASHRTTFDFKLMRFEIPVYFQILKFETFRTYIGALVAAEAIWVDYTFDQNRSASGNKTNLALKPALGIKLDLSEILETFINVSYNLSEFNSIDFSIEDGGFEPLAGGGDRTPLGLYQFTNYTFNLEGIYFHIGVLFKL